MGKDTKLQKNTAPPIQYDNEVSQVPPPGGYQQPPTIGFQQPPYPTDNQNMQKGSPTPPYPAEHNQNMQTSPPPTNNAYSNPGVHEQPPPYTPGPANTTNYVYSPSSPHILTPTTAAVGVNIVTPAAYAVAIDSRSMGPHKVNIQCPFCHENVKTKTDKHNSGMAYLSGGILCMLGCWLGCCLIPCCMDSCKAVEHHCPNCGRFVGKYAKYF